jgi:hypothetical protein
MARKRVAAPPSFDAQRRASGWADGNKRWRGIKTADKPASHAALLVEWVLHNHPGAAALTPGGKGRPPKWRRLLAAAQWLRDYELETGQDIVISAASGSKCVQLIGEFLAKTKGQRGLPPPEGTIQELAGTLVAVVRTITSGFRTKD